MIRVLQSPWLAALIGGLLYLGVTAALFRPGQFVRPPSMAAVAESLGADEPSWKFRNPEFDQWVEEVRREKEALSLREQQLRELQARLNADRQELNSATQTVYQLQADFDRNVVRIKDQEIDNLKRQAKIISGMSPEGAAGLVNEMSEDDAVRVLFVMKVDEASAILETLGKMGQTGARRAAVVTGKMRRTLPPDPNARSKTAS
jgi:flagellar motility protein MotE (MotC chaperone)